MKTFDVYSRSNKGYEAVKKGFSWPAFFFNWIWALIKGLWMIALGFIGVYILLGILYELSNQNPILEIFSNIFLSILVIMFGVKGNDQYRNNLLKRGFNKIGTVNATGTTAAINMVIANQEISKNDDNAESN